MTMPFHKYAHYPTVHLPDRTWPDRQFSRTGRIDLSYVRSSAGEFAQTRVADRSHQDLMPGRQRLRSPRLSRCECQCAPTEGGVPDRKTGD